MKLLLWTFLAALGFAPAATKEDPVSYEVEVDVECKGGDLKKLDLHNGIYVGKVSE